MEDRHARFLGALSALGGVLAVAATVPSRWYGVPDTDAYVFHPPVFTPLWIERSVVPVVAAFAAVLLVAGVAGLLLRDRPVAGRLRRWSGYAALAGLGPFALVLVADAASGGSLLTGAGSPTGAISFLVALLVAVVGLGLALAAMVAMGVGYARTDRQRVGYALAAGPVLSAAFFVGGWVADYGAVGALPVVVPTATAFVVVGVELRTVTEAVPERDDGPENEADSGSTVEGTSAVTTGSDESGEG